MTSWKYDAFLHTFSILVDLFFREVHPRGAWRVPRTGPILFVATNGSLHRTAATSAISSCSYLAVREPRPTDVKQVYGMHSCEST